MPVPLKRHSDGEGNTFYTGVLQFAGTLDLEFGNSIMVFESDADCEEIQISPTDHSKRSKNKRDIITTRFNNSSKIVVPLQKLTDKYNKRYFVGELHGIGSLSLVEGIFFTVFTAKEGMEEIQISRLKKKDKSDE